ncbi:hypothetical protein FF2_031994 [Malus domestica]
MLELTSVKQWKDEPVVDYINRWRSLSLDCIKPRTFEELGTRSHDMELSIANHREKEPIIDFKKDKVFASKVDMTGKKPTNEAFTFNTTLIKTSSVSVKISYKNKAKEIKKGEPSSTQDRYKNTLRELKQKTYPFSDSDMAAMLNSLLEKKVIKLPE